MSRELRMVPPGWQHPTELRRNFHTGMLLPEFVGLLGNNFANALAEWQEGAAQWEQGLRRDYATNGWKPKTPEEENYSYADVFGEPPRAEDYMPAFPEGTATHYVMYETVSEGTPISPAFATAEELARWLADNAASAFGSSDATYDQWLATIHRGFAPSAIIIGGTLIPGVEALAKL